jgi:hypothetical protein
VVVEPEPEPEIVVEPEPEVIAEPEPEPAAEPEPEVIVEPEPEIETELAAAAALPEPLAEGQATGAEAGDERAGVEAPAVTDFVPDEPATAAVPTPLPGVTPQLAAEEDGPVQAGAPLAGVAPQGVAQTPSNRLDRQLEGGNAEQAGQTRADDTADGLGAAAGPDGSDDPTGMPLFRAHESIRESRERPLAVVLDNVFGGQAGLREASFIGEIPVEGGIPRSLAIYDRQDPAQVGPIRSARDYLVQLADSYQGILVHDGGSPQALAAIGQPGALPTLNAFSSGHLFGRAGQRSAPYNLFSSGTGLRGAINNLALQDRQSVTVSVPVLSEAAEAADSVTVSYGQYSSGFVWLQDQNRYRWIRDGQGGRDSAGSDVHVDAVLVANISTTVRDDIGRLYIPMDQGGSGTLYLGGRKLTGSWYLARRGDTVRGVIFTDGEGAMIDLRSFKVWTLFAP